MSQKPYYQRISYRLLQRLYSTITVTFGKQRLRVPIHDEAGLQLLHWKSGWHTVIYQQALNHRSGAFLDVGINVGQTLVDYISLGIQTPQYYGFEPNPHAIAYVYRFLELNQLTGYHAIPIGLSSSTQIIQLQMLQSRSSYSSDARIGFGKSTEPLRNIFIPCYQFDSIRSSLQIPRISVLKVDVEGVELEVLRGMLASLEADRPLITCEVLHRDVDRYSETQYKTTIDALRDLLHSLSYAMYYVCKHDESFTLRKIDRFPEKIWVSPTSFTECDYLFAPDPLAGWGLEQYVAD